MDAGLMVKDIAKTIGVTSDTIINWEKMKKYPSKKNRIIINQQGYALDCGTHYI